MKAPSTDSSSAVRFFQVLRNIGEQPHGQLQTELVVMTDRLTVPDALDFAGRAEFTTAASRLIEHAAERIEVDCSTVVLADDPTVGMLVWLTRNARRRGLSVVLDAPTPVLVAALEKAGVMDRFAVG